MRKIINAEGQDFVPVSTDDLVLDAVPTVNSFNSVTSDAVARAVAGASGEVPQVTENDNGKVLSAIYDEGGPAVEWAEAPSGLPDTTGASQGDVLSIGSTGPEWAAPGGGGSSNVEIIPLSSTTASDLDTFASAVHTAYAAGKVVVAKLVNAESINTMYLPMTKAYEGTSSIQYYFGGQAMYWDDGIFKPEEYYMYVSWYEGDSHYGVDFQKSRPSGTSWSPF